MNNEIKEKLHETGIATVKGLVQAGGIALGMAHPELGAALLLTPIATEFLYMGIPDRKYNRLFQLFTHARSKIDNFDGILTERLKHPGFQDIFEQVVHDASNAMQKDRLKALANILVSGVNPDSDKAQLKYIMSLISRLNDLEILTMLSAARSGLPPDFLTIEECDKITETWLGNTESSKDWEYLRVYSEATISRLEAESIIYKLSSGVKREYIITELGNGLMSYLEVDEDE